MNIEESTLIAVVVALCGALVALWRLDRGALVERIESLEAERVELYEAIEALRSRLDELAPDAALVRRCPAGQGCPLWVDRVTGPVPLPKIPYPALVGVLVLLLCSCTVNPTVMTLKNGRELVTLGGSVGTKADYETATITRPDGTVLSYSRHGKDEVAIPRAYMQARLGEALGRVAGSVTKHAATNETRRVLGAQDVEKVRITAPLNAATEQARIAAETQR
jgi:hypothetical protein